VSNTLKIKIFSDGAKISDIKNLAGNPLIGGFTTNPTLMRSAGVENYEAFAKEAVDIVGDKPISFEVFTDELDEMKAQARQIASWGGNVSVKIPVSNTKGEPTYQIIRELSDEGVVVNVTAIFTDEQISSVIDAINPSASAIVSIFAGRIADAGLDPCVPIERAVGLASGKPGVEILWASTREAFNIIQAENVGCHIITVAPSMINKAMANFGKDLGQYSLETVAMFYDDAFASGYNLS